MRKQGGTPSWRDKHGTMAGRSPPGVARGRFVGGQESGLAGSKPPPLFTRGASSCSSQGHDRVHLPTLPTLDFHNTREVLYPNTQPNRLGYGCGIFPYRDRCVDLDFSKTHESLFPRHTKTGCARGQW